MSDAMLTVLSLSLMGSAVALLWLLLRWPVRRRTSRTWQYYIWLLVVLRFLLPVAPLCGPLKEWYAALQSRGNEAVVAEQQVAPGYGIDAQWLRELPERQPLADGTESAAAPASPALSGEELLRAAFVVWMGVAGVLLVRSAVAYYRFRRQVLAGAREVDDEAVCNLYQDELALRGIRRRVALCCNEAVPSPMLMGWLRPVVVLPKLNGNREQLRFILRHELIHCKRRDILYKWLVQLLVCVHWFNPLVRVVARQIDKACELACDEGVVRGLSWSERVLYGDALLACVRVQSGRRRHALGLTMSEEGKSVCRRLDALTARRGRGWPLRCATALLSAVLLGGFVFAGALSAAARPVAAPAAGVAVGVEPLSEPNDANAGPVGSQGAEPGDAAALPAAKPHQSQQHSDRDGVIHYVDVYADVVDVVLVASDSDTFAATLRYPASLDFWYAEAELTLDVSGATCAIEVSYPGGEIPQSPGLHELATLTVQLPRRQYEALRLTTLAAHDGSVITIPVAARRFELVNVAGDVSYRLPHAHDELLLNNKAGNVTLTPSVPCASTHIASKVGEIYLQLPTSDATVDFVDVRMGDIDAPAPWQAVAGGDDGTVRYVRGSGEHHIAAELEIGTLHLL